LFTWENHLLCLNLCCFCKTKVEMLEFVALMAECLANNLWKFHQKILNYSENNEIFVGCVCVFLAAPGMSRNTAIITVTSTHGHVKTWEERHQRSLCEWKYLRNTARQTQHLKRHSHNGYALITLWPCPSGPMHAKGPPWTISLPTSVLLAQAVFHSEH